MDNSREDNLLLGAAAARKEQAETAERLRALVKKLLTPFAHDHGGTRRLVQIQLLVGTLGFIGLQVTYVLIVSSDIDQIAGAPRVLAVAGVIILLDVVTALLYVAFGMS